MADHRHKRVTDARRKPKAMAVIGPLAVLATAAAVTVGVVAVDPAQSDQTLLSSGAPSAASTDASAPSTAATETPSSAASAAPERTDPVTRNEDRMELRTPTTYAPRFMSKDAVKAAVANAQQTRWTTTDLNLWNQPGAKAKEQGEIEGGKKVLITGREIWGRTEVVVDGQSRWVTDGYLSHDKPVGPAAGLSDAPCPDGSVENGLTSGAVFVYRSVCHAFPQITSYGGWDAHGEHASGKALDIMTSDVELGTAIAEFLRSHASELGLYDVIWRQHIWTPVRSSEGWRSMPSRGSATADHYDHVHVAVN